MRQRPLVLALIVGLTGQSIITALGVVEFETIPHVHGSSPFFIATKKQTWQIKTVLCPLHCTGGAGAGACRL